MKLVRTVHGIDFADHLCRRWNYVIVNQTGSHMKLRTDLPTRHTITIPAHKPMKTGTFSAILKEICQHKGVSRDELLHGL